MDYIAQSKDYENISTENIFPKLHISCSNLVNFDEHLVMRNNINVTFVFIHFETYNCWLIDSVYFNYIGYFRYYK